MNAPQHSNAFSRRLVVALDVPSPAEAMALVDVLAPLNVTFKVGMELFYGAGMPLVKAIQAVSFTPVFVDLKLHDIPNTVQRTAHTLVSQGVGFFNVHTQGGPDMLKAAVVGAQQAAQDVGVKPPMILGVTVLTSLSQPVLNDALGIPGSLADYGVRLACLAKEAGLSGVVCSAHEVSQIKSACGEDFICLTPGIRPQSNAVGDQARVMTPALAIDNGSDYLVVGRPITQAENPKVVAQAILDEMASAAPHQAQRV